MQGLQEVGQAIEEVTMERAVEKYGPEYAERVTQKYLSAGGEGCRAAIKTVSVASMGFHGFVAGMAIEGVDYAVNLKDYLVGPILLQNYLQVLQYPLTRSIRYFTVLRPWCIAFYYHHNEFSSKPHKIIATSNLDTMPKLRQEMVQHPTSGEMLSMNYIEISTLDGSVYALRLDSICQQEYNLFQTFNAFELTDFLPNNTEPNLVTGGSDVILEWFRQIQDGSRRMETIKKHQSGAVELREERWLKRCPRGIGWKWNGDIPEVIPEDFVYTFSIHGLHISTEQLKEAMEVSDSKKKPVEAEALDEICMAEVISSESVQIVEEEAQDIEVTLEENNMISSLVEILGLNRSQAKNTLKNADWDINRALDNHDLLGISEIEPPSSPPSYHSVVAVPVDMATASDVSAKSSLLPDYPPSIAETARAMKRTAKADISSVTVTLKVVTQSGFSLILI